MERSDVAETDSEEVKRRLAAVYRLLVEVAEENTADGCETAQPAAPSAGSSTPAKEPDA